MIVTIQTEPPLSHVLVLLSFVAALYAKIIRSRRDTLVVGSIGRLHLLVTLAFDGAQRHGETLA